MPCGCILKVWFLNTATPQTIHLETKGGFLFVLKGWRGTRFRGHNGVCPPVLVTAPLKIYSIARRTPPLLWKAWVELTLEDTHERIQRFLSVVRWAPSSPLKGSLGERGIAPSPLKV